MTPYYEADGVTIYHGDCLDVMNHGWFARRMGTSAFDLLLTDPPYGIKEAAGKNASRSKPFGGKANGLSHDGAVVAAVDYGASEWDDRPAYEAIAMARSIAKYHIIFGGNYYDLPPSSCWLVWDKDNGASHFADCELAWTNLRKAVRRLRYRWNGMLQEPGVPREHREHPTQKPEAVMRWALMQAPTNVQTVLDPFMGSGTTLVAAKRLGKRAIGIEREEHYCQIAVRRLAQGALFGEATA